MKTKVYTRGVVAVVAAIHSGKIGTEQNYIEKKPGRSLARLGSSTCDIDTREGKLIALPLLSARCSCLLLPSCEDDDSLESTMRPSDDEQWLQSLDEGTEKCLE